MVDGCLIWMTLCRGQHWPATGSDGGGGSHSAERKLCRVKTCYLGHIVLQHADESYRCELLSPQWCYLNYAQNANRSDSYHVWCSQTTTLAHSCIYNVRYDAESKWFWNHALSPIIHLYGSSDIPISSRFNIDGPTEDSSLTGNVGGSCLFSMQTGIFYPPTLSKLVKKKKKTQGFHDLQNVLI